jgi:MinD-like ATPase involved in chromosome partitioning or flagellar assembly
VSAHEVERTIGTSVLDRRATSAVGYYNFICADDGQRLLSPAARGVLSTVSGLLIASSASIDGRRQAAATLDWLRQNGYQCLLAHACVVINHLVPGKPGVDVADLTVRGRHSGSRVSRRSNVQSAGIKPGHGAR